MSSLTRLLMLWRMVRRWLNERPVTAVKDSVRLHSTFECRPLDKVSYHTWIISALTFSRPRVLYWEHAKQGAAWSSKISIGQIVAFVSFLSLVLAGQPQLCMMLVACLQRVVFRAQALQFWCG